MQKHKKILAEVICLLVVVVGFHAIDAAESDVKKHDWASSAKAGAICYQNNEIGKAVVEFKTALAEVFPEGTSDQSGQSEATLRAMFDDKTSAAKSRYHLGLICETQGKLDEAAILFRDSLAIVSTQGATYLGYKDGCKSCHFKEWKSWKDTKMAKAFESLKPDVSVETKIKFNLDPKKDYTEDPTCLGCHTTGFGLPKGYVIPRGAKYKVRKASKQTAGGTCEVCHGPGSKYGPIHKDVDDKARPYRSEEFFAAGEYRVDEHLCMKCHNRRNPTAGPDFSFDFKSLRDGSHENFELIYRIKDPLDQTEENSQVERNDP